MAREPIPSRHPTPEEYPLTATGPTPAKTNDPSFLIVDLDGTLLKTDTLHEGLIALLTHKPYRLFRIAPSLIAGRAAFKDAVARETTLSYELLPLNEQVVAMLRQQADAGRRLLLATGAHRSFAAGIAARLGCFEAVIASDERTNCTGAKKLEAIRMYCGQADFDYIGNSPADVPIWTEARKAYTVAGSAKQSSVQPICVSHGHRGWVRDLLIAMRPHQWVKNLLVLIPILLGHKFNDPARVLATGLAFLAFCLAASGAYLLNDVLDLDADRNHPAKRMRPFASGSAPLWAGMAAAPILLLAAFAVALSVSPALAGVIMAYCVATCAYSLKLKRIALLDVVTLAGLYAVRLIGGSAATQVPLSPWTIAFFMFLFLSLAMMKRYSELLALGSNGVSRVEGRGYRASDLVIIGNMGSAAGYISILTLALYVHSNDVALLYRHPSRLWALCVIGLYGISRMWLIAHRGEMNDDPILFVLRDRVSYVLAAVAAACFVWSL